MNTMRFDSSFTELSATSIHQDAAARQAEGWRYVQMLAVNGDDGIDLIYSYMREGHLMNMVVKQVPHGGAVTSISDVFFEAFVCENEISDLFGIKFNGLVLDFLGNFYKLSTEKPMTIISPEQLAEREKQRKIAAAKAAKEAKAKAEAAGEAPAKKEPKPDSDEEFEAKLKSLDPEKAAKVRAAMEAKAAKEAKAAAEAEAEEAAARAEQDKVESIGGMVFESSDGSEDSAN